MSHINMFGADNGICNQRNKNYFLKIDRNISRALGSEQAAVVMDRLEYWFSRRSYRDGFWKFFEPCDHRLYREGDSWSEETGYSRKVFSRVFNIIGTHYKSKSEFMAQSDPFQGKMYASYYERNTNRTHFFRNHNFVSDFLTRVGVKLKAMLQQNAGISERKGSSGNVPSVSSPYNKDIQRNTSPLSHDEKSGGESRSKKDDKTSSEMLDLWNHLTNDKTPFTQQLQRRLESSLVQNFEGSIENWRGYCQKIASSKFLMGEAARSKFKAGLLWAIKSETVEAIMRGTYSLGDRIVVEEGGVQVQSIIIDEIKRIDEKIETIHEEVKREKRVDFRKKIDAMTPEIRENLREEFCRLQAKNTDGFACDFAKRQWEAPFAETLFEIFAYEELKKDEIMISEEEEVAERLTASGLLERKQTLIEQRNAYCRAGEGAKNLFSSFVLKFKGAY